ncbi:RDD family protein [Amycolatopsis magusensis]|uniref:RDD family membrane protein YckC n=1 Tax=Amycolatopsis magusensis TaxID=882444 RepID=A0ABS4Q674_9PSEU|nr:RDD family protein [Amycolatopsis magusensis]MBP2187093.1 putative RDD family membrane protein YckC [Amycolatopsis magusensis]
MARWTGEWLPGAREAGASADGESQRWRGERLGLPENGPGSIATGGRRLLGLVLDLVLASLVTSVFVQPRFDQPEVMESYNLWSVLVWALITMVPVSFFGFTPGMGIVGIRVARLDGASMVGLWRAVVRGLLTFIIVPAALRNVDGRSLLDRATGTAVLRLR